jgi:hypothetical protein
MTPSREEIEDDIVIVIEDDLYKKQEARERKRRITGAGRWDLLFDILGRVAYLAFWAAVIVAILSIVSVMGTI